MCVCTHILDVVKARRSSFASVFQRLGGKSLIVTVQETEGRNINECQRVAFLFTRDNDRQLKVTLQDLARILNPRSEYYI